MAAQESGSLNVLSWNVRGLGSRLSEVKKLVTDQKIDIMCLVETRAKSDDKFSETDFPDFEVIGKSVNKLKESSQRVFPGGLLFAYRKALPYTFSKLPNKSYFILWVKAKPENPEENVSMIFAVIYNPLTDKTTKEKILRIMEREYKILDEDHTEAKFYIMGDFNACTFELFETHQPRVREFEEEKNDSNANYEENGITLVGFCDNTGFCIANGRFGNQSASHTTSAHVLDYLLCRHKDWSFLTDFKVDGFHRSDHRALIFTLKVLNLNSTTVHEPEPERLELQPTMQFRLTLNLQESEHDLAIIWSTGQPDEPNSDELIKYENTCTTPNLHVCVKQTILFTSHCKVQAVPQEQEPEIPTMMHTFSVALCSQPLLVENILCFYLDYHSNLHRGLRTVQGTVKNMYSYCFRNYPGATFTFLGTFFTKTVIDIQCKDLKKTVHQVMYGLFFKLNMARGAQGTHELEETKVTIKKIQHGGQIHHVVLWKFVLRQLFKSVITPAFHLDDRLRHYEGHELTLYTEQLKTLITARGLQKNAKLLFWKMYKNAMARAQLERP
ncbi:uncharacterized protein LOC110981792 isoform X1 [Acanthaster planci]|uniref:Uncharacterized protein LOC110981792 isoform X1 n=1 Tax=Acanthaster planci TaxID=133434 RepID=A0A8B7YSF4_ACAPL|nr:uncharacterized protein LOC110981792 isoform X1 [Acanthaster planci]XP_022095394.1 uncharacterized protein LOC110981792 isoform X1 [Acanthaster planci]XP_022095395.1 uncharacterized protein LOC110981792 isoform X1 [Acanthaster planci]